MNKETKPERHEFWIKRNPEGDQNPETTGVYRVTLGELIDASKRQTFRPPEYSHSPDFWNKSGSIGFMDVTVSTQWVPKENAASFPNPNNSPYLEHEYLRSEGELTRTLTIQTIGIEPEYRGRGYARILAQKAAELATEWGLDTIVADMIENPAMKDWIVRLGGVLYDHGSRAVIRIKSIQPIVDFTS